MAKSKDSIRLKAEAHYIENIDADLKEVSELFDAHYDTIRDWAKKYDWEEKRLNFHASPTIIKQKLQQETISIMNGGLPKFSADAVSKLMASLDRCDKQADPIVVQRILRELDNFISRLDPGFANKCTPYHKMFLQHRIKMETS